MTLCYMQSRLIKLAGLKILRNKSNNLACVSCEPAAVRCSSWSMTGTNDLQALTFHRETKTKTAKSGLERSRRRFKTAVSDLSQRSFRSNAGQTCFVHEAYPIAIYGDLLLYLYSPPVVKMTPEVSWMKYSSANCKLCGKFRTESIYGH